MTDYVPTPLILDSTILHELARGDAGTIALIQGFDAQQQPMVVSALAITRTLVHTRTDDAADAMHGLATMEHITIAPLKDAEQAAALADVILSTGLEITEAHTAAIAEASVCPILTLDAARWTEPSQALEQRLHTIEVDDPDM